MSTSSTSLRQRVVPAAPSPPPTVDGVEGLSAALRQVREAASTRGVTQDEFSQCIHSLTKITSSHKKTEKPMRKKNRKCCSRLYSCYKIVWILWLLFLAMCMIVIVYRPAGHLLHKVMLFTFFIVLLNGFFLTVGTQASVHGHPSSAHWHCYRGAVFKSCWV